MTDAASTIGTPAGRVSDHLFRHATATPDAPAFKTADRVYTYAEAAREVDALACALLAAGVEKGDRVAALLPPAPEFLISFLAVASVGAIWVGLNPRHQLPEMRAMVADAAPHILLARRFVAGRDLGPELAALSGAERDGPELVLYDGPAGDVAGRSFEAFVAAGSDIAAAQLPIARAEAGGRDPCLIVYTSGSTGVPKGALLHHDAISTFAVRQNQIWPLSPHRVLNFLPSNHVGSIVDLSMPAVAAGGTIVFMEQFDPEASVAMMAAERITLWGSVPSVFELQLKAALSGRYDLSNLQLIVWEGAAMAADTIAALMTLGVPMATNYGLTEACGAATIMAPTQDPERLLSGVGDPFPEVEIMLADAAGAPIVGNGPGEILLRSRYNMLGYWRRPDADAAAFSADGCLRTGDLGARNDDGSYRLVGRLSDMYKSGGYNVYPREIEAVITAHSQIAEAVVVGRPDRLWGETGVAFYTSRELVTPAVLDAWCRERLANYKIPKQFVRLENMPLLPIGKVDRAALRRRAAEPLHSDDNAPA